MEQKNKSKKPSGCDAQSIVKIEKMMNYILLQEKIEQKQIMQKGKKNGSR